MGLLTYENSHDSVEHDSAEVKVAVLRCNSMEHLLAGGAGVRVLEQTGSGATSRQ